MYCSTDKSVLHRYNRRESAFWFPRLPAASDRRGCGQAGTRPEDHGEVCARTGVPPSGKERLTLPSTKENDLPSEKRNDLPLQPQPERSHLPSRPQPKETTHLVAETPQPERNHAPCKGHNRKETTHLEDRNKEHLILTEGFISSQAS